MSKWHRMDSNLLYRVDHFLLPAENSSHSLINLLVGCLLDGARPKDGSSKHRREQLH